MTEALDPIPLSALQHWSYCPRQCALIHLEQAFAENVHTLRGQAVHHIVDAPGFETRAGCRLALAPPSRSTRQHIRRLDIAHPQPLTAAAVIHCAVVRVGLSVADPAGFRE
jgi:hypothetical protein